MLLHTLGAGTSGLDISNQRVFPPSSSSTPHDDERASTRRSPRPVDAPTSGRLSSGLPVVSRSTTSIRTLPGALVVVRTTISVLACRTTFVTTSPRTSDTDWTKVPGSSERIPWSQRLAAAGLDTSGARRSSWVEEPSPAAEITRGA